MGPRGLSLGSKLPRPCGVFRLIYTHSLPAYVAVVWSGLFDFLGVLTSTGVVAFGIVSLRLGRARRDGDDRGGRHVGLPVSTTHVLSSGVAGTMAANGSGLQWSTVRNLALAWILTLPISIVLAGSLFWIFRHLF